MNTHTSIPAAPAATMTIDYAQDPRWAYLEFLHYEARLLRMELASNLDPDCEFTPSNTFSKCFHFPRGKKWTDVPKPSTRALQVMQAAGVKIPEGVQ